MRVFITFYLLVVALPAAVTYEFTITGNPLVATESSKANLTFLMKPPKSLTSDDAIKVTVDWQNLKNVHYYSNGKDDPAEQDDHFKDRTTLHLEGFSKGDIVLELKNLSTNDTGNYTCMVTVIDENNEVHSERGIVQLVVNRKINKGEFRVTDSPTTGKQDPPTTSTGLIISVVVVGCIVGLIFIALLLWCIRKEYNRGSSGGSSVVRWKLGNGEDQVEVGVRGGPAHADDQLDRHGQYEAVQNDDVNEPLRDDGGAENAQPEEGNNQGGAASADNQQNNPLLPVGNHDQQLQGDPNH